MYLRLRAVRSLALLLYVGPLSAGIGGLGLGIILPFVLIFMIWLIVLRPEQWPATLPEWRDPQTWVAVLTQLLAQTLLVSILLAVGRGLGAMAEVPPIIGPLFPLAISFLAIPLCRSLWDADAAARTGVYLDEDAKAGLAPRAAAHAAAAVVPLINLSDDVDDETATDSVHQVMSVEGAHLRLRALAAALRRPDRSHVALRRALLIWASEPEVVANGRVPGAMATAFEIAGEDTDLLRLYLPRALALIAAFPNRVRDFPAAEDVHLVGDRLLLNPPKDLPADLGNDLREGLRAFSVAIERAWNDHRSLDEEAR